MTYLEVVLSQVPLRWGLEELCVREVEAIMENVPSKNSVSTKTASLDLSMSLLLLFAVLIFDKIWPAP